MRSSTLSSFSFDSDQIAPTNMTIQAGSATVSSVRYEKRRSATDSSRQPMIAALAAVTKPPTSTIAPRTCTTTAIVMLSGRIVRLPA